MRLGEGPSRQIEHPSDANKTVRIHKKVIPLLEIRPRFQAYVVALPSFATLPADIDKVRDTFSCKISITGSPGHFAAINTKPWICFMLGQGNMFLPLFSDKKSYLWVFRATIAHRWFPFHFSESGHPYKLREKGPLQPKKSRHVLRSFAFVCVASQEASSPRNYFSARHNYL